MGRVKALMMEMEEHGYDFLERGEKYACSHHFEDKYLNDYIKKHGGNGVCSYCGHKGTVIDMSDLADHIGMTISVYFNDVDSECLPLASSFYDDEDEQIPGIKRAGSFAVPEGAEVYEDTSEMMEELDDVLHNTDMILCSILVGTTLYRTRSLNKELDDSFGFKDITSAPNSSAGQCRMSPAGVSMFYGAFDKETAVAESIKLADEKVLVIGEFKTIRELMVVDLTALPTDVSIWMGKWEGIAFLKSFHKDITQPLLKEAKEAIEYVPSQIFTEYLRWMFTDKKGRHVDGLIYESCKTKKANVVLFCNNEVSREWVKLESFSTKE